MSGRAISRTLSALLYGLFLLALSPDTLYDSYLCMPLIILELVSFKHDDGNDENN